MSDILVVTATEAEAIETRGFANLLVTGPGITATVYHLTRQLQKKRYSLILNIGICGTLDDSIALGEVVWVTNDKFADFGAEDGDNFLDAAQIGLMDPNEKPFNNGLLVPNVTMVTKSLDKLKKVSGITVQKVHGSESSCLQAKALYGDVVESMEGAAVFYCSIMEEIPCIQIRAVSNRVERRNREAWQIGKALDSLKNFMQPFAKEIASMR
jgi:futalosine hydrolase